MKQERVPVVVVGANGYTGEELVRLLLSHPGVELRGVTSRQHAGKTLAEVFPRFFQLPGAELAFTEPTMENLLALSAECYFLALPHGVAGEFASGLQATGRRIIDISADFRLRDPACYEEFYEHPHPHPELLSQAVYGLPEVYREQIRSSSLVAAPGCYPTSILLPLIPLLRARAIDPASICVASASGTSGAGRKADETLLFAECLGSLRAYGIPKHRHLSEIEQELSLAAEAPVHITFVPHLAPMVRGIHTTIFAQTLENTNDPLEMLRAAYAEEPFVRVRDSLPDTKHVTGTNFCDISARFDPRTGRLVLLSAIDNLGKGAGSQGVQCFNLLFGFPEQTGLL
jgi:N-acetyl-gamma-glutamyl-phosphate reductase